MDCGRLPDCFQLSAEGDERRCTGCKQQTPAGGMLCQHVFQKRKVKACNKRVEHTRQCADIHSAGHWQDERWIMHSLCKGVSQCVSMRGKCHTEMSNATRAQRSHDYLTDWLWHHVLCSTSSPLILSSSSFSCSSVAYCTVQHECIRTCAATCISQTLILNGYCTVTEW